MTPPPDIMVITAGYFLRHAIEQHQILDLTDLWEQAGLSATFRPGFQKLSLYEGKQYYVPIGYTSTGIYYNTKIFDQLNLVPPTTWSEFLSLCDTLLANGITPLSLAGRDSRLAMLWFDYLDLRINGADFHRQLINGDIAYTDTRLLEVFDTWRSLFAHGYFVDQPEGMNSLASMTAIVRSNTVQLGGSQAAMTLISPSWFSDLPPQFEQQLDFFRFPIMDPSQPVDEVLTTYGYIIPVASEHKEQAVDFLTYLSSSEAQTHMAQQLGAGTADLAPANANLDPNLLSVNMRKGMSIVNDAADVLPSYMYSTPDGMWNPITQALRSFLSEPDKTDNFATALENARQNAISSNLLTPDQSQ